MQKVAFITGASAGIGKATAQLLNQRGYRVYAAARRLDKMEDLRQQGIHILSLDVSQEVSITTAVETILAEAGTIDILINNAFTTPLKYPGFTQRTDVLVNSRRTDAYGLCHSIPGNRRVNVYPYPSHPSWREMIIFWRVMISHHRMWYAYFAEH